MSNETIYFHSISPFAYIIVQFAHISGPLLAKQFNQARRTWDSDDTHINDSSISKLYIEKNKCRVLVSPVPRPDERKDHNHKFPAKSQKLEARDQENFTPDHHNSGTSPTKDTRMKIMNGHQGCKARSRLEEDQQEAIQIAQKRQIVLYKRM